MSQSIIIYLILFIAIYAMCGRGVYLLTSAIRAALGFNEIPEEQTFTILTWPFILIYLSFT